MFSDNVFHTHTILLTDAKEFAKVLKWAPNNSPSWVSARSVTEKVQPDEPSHEGGTFQWFGQGPSGKTGPLSVGTVLAGDCSKLTSNDDESDGHVSFVASFPSRVASESARYAAVILQSHLPKAGEKGRPFFTLGCANSHRAASKSRQRARSIAAVQPSDVELSPRVLRLAAKCA